MADDGSQKEPDPDSEADQKTQRLRDVFVETTGTEEVTERQEESPGSLSENDADVEMKVHEIISRMRDRYEFRCDLDDDDLAAVAKRFHEDASDEEIAADLGLSADTVREARLDLHLIRADDRDAPFDLDALRSLIVDGVASDERADRLAAETGQEVDPGVVSRYARVVNADLASTRANDRFRDEFAEVLSDADLEGQLASDAREDGLAEATEDMETDVDF